MDKNPLFHGYRTALLIWVVVAALLTGILVFGITRGTGQRAWSFSFLPKSTFKTAEVTRSLDVSGIQNISLSGGNTDLHITTSSDAQIHVDAVVPADEKASAVSVSGGTLTISVEKTNGWWNLFYNPDSGTRIDLALPASYTGNLSLTTASGDLSFGTLTGTGKVSMVSDDLTAGLGTLNGALQISCVSGDIDLSLPSDASAYLSLEALSGEVRSDFPLSSSGSHREEGQVGSASSASLNIHSVSGDITLSKK